MKNINKLKKLSIASAVLLASTVPAVVFAESVDLIGKSNVYNQNETIKVTNLGDTNLKISDMFDISKLPNLKGIVINVEILDANGNNVVDDSIKYTFNEKDLSLDFKYLKSGNYNSKVTISYNESELESEAGNFTETETFEFIIESQFEDIKVGNLKEGDFITIADTKYILVNKEKGQFISEKPVNISSIDLNNNIQKQVESIYLNSFKGNVLSNFSEFLRLNNTNENIKSKLDIINENEFRNYSQHLKSYTDEVILSNTGKIISGVQSESTSSKGYLTFVLNEDIILDGINSLDNVSEFKGNTNLVQKEFSINSDEDVKSFDLRKIIGNDRNDEFIYFISDEVNEGKNGNYNIDGNILNVESVLEGNDVLEINVLDSKTNLINSFKLEVNTTSNTTTNAELKDTNLVTYDTAKTSLEYTLKTDNYRILSSDLSGYSISNGKVTVEKDSYVVLGYYNSNGKLISIEKVIYENSEVVVINPGGVAVVPVPETDDKKDESNPEVETKPVEDKKDETDSEDENKPVDDKKDETETETDSDGETETDSDGETKPVEDKKDETDSKDETKPAEVFDLKWNQNSSQQSSLKKGEKVLIDLTKLHGKYKDTNSNYIDVLYKIESSNSNVSYKVFDNGVLEITALTEGTSILKLKLLSGTNESDDLDLTFDIVKEDIIKEDIKESNVELGSGISTELRLADYINNFDSSLDYKLKLDGSSTTNTGLTYNVDNITDSIKISSSASLYSDSTFIVYVLENGKEVTKGKVKLSINKNLFGLAKEFEVAKFNKDSDIRDISYDLTGYINKLSNTSNVTVSTSNNFIEASYNKDTKNLVIKNKDLIEGNIHLLVKDGSQEIKVTIPVKVSGNVFNSTIEVKGNNKLIKPLSSYITLENGEKISDVQITKNEGKFIKVTKDGDNLTFEGVANGTEDVILTVKSDKGNVYTLNLKVTLADFKNNSSNGLTITSKSNVSTDVLSEITLDFDGTKAGELLKETNRLVISKDKVTNGSSTIDLKVSYDNSTYVFMKLDNDKLISVPFYYNSNGELIVDVNYEGDLIFTKETISYNNIYGHYAESYIKDLSKKKVLESSWTSSDEFEINKAVKGKEFTNSLSRALGFSENDKSMLVSQKLISQALLDEIDSKDVISRETAITVLHNMLKFKDLSLDSTNVSTFVDFDSVSNDKKESVATLQKLGVIHGKPGLVFDPLAELTRAQFSKVMYLTLRITQD